MSPKTPARRKPRSGIMNEQVLAERVAAGMMAKDQFSQWLGITIVDVRPRTATVRATVRPEMVNGFGVTHGAIAFAIADSAFAFACNTHGRVTVSIDNSITYPMAIMPGDVLTAVAESESEGNRLGYYRAVVKNQRDEVVALFRGTAYKTKNQHKETTEHAEYTEKATAKAGGTTTVKDNRDAK